MKWEPFETTCPGCGEKVTSYWASDNTGCDSRPEYTLVADCVWHAPCFDKAIENYATDPRPSEDIIRAERNEWRQ